MRVIVDRSNIEREHKCKRCGSVYAYTPKDVSFLLGMICCPLCHNWEQPTFWDKIVKSKENK